MRLQPAHVEHKREQAAEERIEALEKGGPQVSHSVSEEADRRVAEAEARAAEACEKADDMKDTASETPSGAGLACVWVLRAHVCLTTQVANLEAQLAKLKAKLTAVSTLYTESMQREAMLKVQLDQLKEQQKD